MRSTANTNKMRLWLIMVLVISLLTVPAGSARARAGDQPDGIILSLAGDVCTSLAVSWTAKSPDQAWLEYMSEKDFLGLFTGAQQMRAEATVLPDGRRRFHAHLEDLEPQTRYVYRVGGQEAWSEPRVFKTGSDGDSFVFWYLGDVQAGYRQWGELVDRALQNSPASRFAVLGGDIVDRGHDLDEWQRFLTAAQSVFSRVPLMAAVGNHDDTQLFADLFARPPNGPAGHEDTMYSFDYGNCHLTVLNSNALGIPGTLEYNKVAHWLRQDLTTSDKDWRILVLHHPPYQALQDWRGQHLQDHWVPIWEEGGVDLVLSGHQHVYMRSKPLWQGEIAAAGSGIIYVIGNSGSKHYGAGPGYDYVEVELAGISTWQEIEISGQTLTLTSKDVNGQVVDSFAIAKQVGASAEALKPAAGLLAESRIGPGPFPRLAVFLDWLQSGRRSAVYAK